MGLFRPLLNAYTLSCCHDKHFTHKLIIAVCVCLRSTSCCRTHGQEKALVSPRHRRQLSNCSARKRPASSAPALNMSAVFPERRHSPLPRDVTVWELGFSITFVRVCSSRDHPTIQPSKGDARFLPPFRKSVKAPAQLCRKPACQYVP